MILRRRAFKMPEPYAGKLARTVLRGRKLPGCPSERNRDTSRMYKKTILIFLIFFITQLVYSQELMTKQEIYQNWNKQNTERDNPENYKIGFDSIVVAFVDSLKNYNIDTLGVYEQDYVGAELLFDSCMCGIIPWEAHIDWIKNGLTYHKKITEGCQSKSKRIEYSVLINYYISAKSKIDKERIMPVIIGTSKDKAGHISIDFSMVDHTTDYTIYCTLNGHIRFTRFQYYDLVTKEGIFQKDNENSAINSWRKMIDNQIKEIENK